MAVVTRAMLVWSREPSTRARWTGMAGWPRLAAMRRMPASEPVQASRRPSWTALSLIETRFSQILLSGRVYVIYRNSAAP